MKIDKMYSIHYSNREPYGDMICEAETRDAVIELAENEFLQRRADEGLTGDTSESLVIVLSYDNGNESYEHYELEYTVEYDDSVSEARSDYYASAI